MDQTQVSRRAFIKNSAAAAATLAAAPTVLAASNAVRSPNERIRIGFIGLGERCDTHLDSAAESAKGHGARGSRGRLRRVWPLPHGGQRTGPRDHQGRAEGSGRLSRHHP